MNRLMMVVAALWALACQPDPSEVVGPAAGDVSDQLRRDPRMASFLNEALSEAPDEVYLGQLVSGMVMDYGLENDGEVEYEKCIATGLDLAMLAPNGTRRCDYDQLLGDAFSCSLEGVGVGSIFRAIGGGWGRSAIGGGAVAANCARLAVTRNCTIDWNSFGNIGGSGGGGGGGSF